MTPFRTALRDLIASAQANAAGIGAAARGAALIASLAAGTAGGAGCISVPDEVEEEFAPAGEGARNHFGRIVSAADGAP